MQRTAEGREPPQSAGNLSKNYAELKEQEANLSICEQRFRHIARHRHSFRFMNRQRFRFMLMALAWFDHQARDSGLM